MNRRLSTSRATFATGNDSLTIDEKPKQSIPLTRRHFYNRKPERLTTTTTTTKVHLGNAKLYAILLLVLLILLFWTALSRSSVNTEVSLRDQPAYGTLLSKRQCAATLCNPQGRCATWYPHDEQYHHDSTGLKEEGMYRNVATIQVDLGCELLLKTADDTWMTISEGQTDCAEKGCQDVVEVDLRGDLYILASQLKQMIADPATMEQEVIVAYTGQQSSESPDVTLVSQFSVNRLGVFTQVLDAWAGPVSVAIYLTEPNDVNYLRSFFAVPANVILYSRVNIVFVKPDYTNSDRLKYPINHLRNLAITASTTSHVFVMDADFTPPGDMYAHAQTKLLPLTEGRVAMVIPCYAILESHKDDPLPQDINELKELVKDGVAYITDPGSGHGPTLAMSMALNPNQTLYYEVCYESQWEPYYIVPRETTPLYDARFLNQGGDKQSHALQLNALGFKFLVSHHTFILHKDHSKMVWPGGGFSQSQKAKSSWSYFEGFMREMEELYGSNVRWPKGCSANAIGWQAQLRNPLGMAIGA